ncbi:Guanine deaminase [Rubripirellula obstinata]|uniref:Guanine deaminase n=1 Tax=Rubripirellula obstinata TaxID=406547 RepID=A0A5B1CEN4_9BACT|nr:amidohydrolase family protein [Rubripirellula obstinata]KAA1258681.1 Guanine deaminase [Rubripirellula obstinata]
MIVAGNLLVPSGLHECSLRPGTIRVVDGLIQQIQWDEISEHADFGGEGFLITPGFIDAHVHLPQFDLIGAHGMPLLRWLMEATFPAEAKWADVDYAKEMTGRVAKQLIGHGTTGIAAYATVHHQSAIAAIEILRSFGMHGLVGQVLMDREAPSEICRPATQLIDEAAVLQERFPTGNDSGARPLSAAVTPRFAIACTEELLIGAGRIAEQYQCFVQSHLAETQAECDLVGQLFDGRSYVSVYQDAGLLNERSIYGHGIHLSASDLTEMSESRAVIAHCPTANSFLRSGIMNRHERCEAGVRVAIGSDIGAGYHRSMVRVAAALIEAAAMIGDEFPTAAQAWHCITAGNANVLGLSEVGSIQVGHSADLVVARPNIAWLAGGADPLSMAMWAWDDRWIEEVVIRGRPSLTLS